MGAPLFLRVSLFGLFRGTPKATPRSFFWGGVRKKKRNKKTDPNELAVTHVSCRSNVRILRGLGISRQDRGCLNRIKFRLV